MSDVVTFIQDHWVSIALPVGSVIAGYFVGFILEKIAVRYLLKWSARTSHAFDDVLAQGLNGVLRMSLLLLSLFLVLQFIEIDDVVKNGVETGIAVCAILVAALYLSRTLSGLADNYSREIYGGRSSSLIRVVARTIVIIIGLLVVLSKLGISITPILTALGVGGLAVALALQDTLANFFAGIQLLATRKFRPGDFVELKDNQSGYINDISWRDVTLRTVHNNLIVVPNSEFGKSIVKNYNFPAGDFTSEVTVGVHYDSDLDFVEQVALEVARDVESRFGTPGQSPGPYLWFSSFADSAIEFRVMLQTNDYRSHFKLKHEFVKHLHKRFNKENIEIPYPIRNLYLRNGVQVETKPD